MTRQHAIFLASAGSFLLLAAAFLFQSLGWAPCTLCIWQRWPHVAAAALGATALVFGGPRVLALLGAVAAMTATALALYHTGVELKWWAGPSACSGGGNDLGGLSATDLLPSAPMTEALPSCDAFTPFLFGLSMANWNAVASLVLVGIWVRAAMIRS